MSAKCHILCGREAVDTASCCATFEADSMPAAQMFAHDDPGIVSAENIASNWRKPVRNSSDLHNVPTASVAMGVTDYAKARAKFGRGEIWVLRQDGAVESVIGI